MTREEYLKKLAELKAKAERAVIGRLPKLETQAYDLLLEFINANLDTQNGRFVANEAATKALNSFPDIYIAALTELSDYKGSVGQYLKNFKDIETLMSDFQKSQGLDVKKARLNSVHDVVVNEIVNMYSENGLNPGFVQPMRQLLFNNITSGTNKNNALQQLRDYIESGQDQSGKLSKYLTQTAQQGVDSYTGAINTRIMQTFKIDTMIMSGSLIATSTPQCRYGINKLDGIIDRADWPKLKAIAMDNGLIEGTTFDNLPFNKLHWGCRHEFTPTVLTDKQREALTSQPTNK